jgi:hypothetical protein
MPVRRSLSGHSVLNCHRVPVDDRHTGISNQEFVALVPHNLAGSMGSRDACTRPLDDSLTGLATRSLRS